MKQFKGLSVPKGVNFKSGIKLITDKGHIRVSECFKVTAPDVTKIRCWRETNCSSCIFCKSNAKKRAEYWKSLQKEGPKMNTMPEIQDGDILVCDRDSIIETIWIKAGNWVLHFEIGLGEAILGDAPYKLQDFDFGDVVYIYRSSYGPSKTFISKLLDAQVNPIWTKGEEPALEVTMKEVSAKFGRPVKIVEEK